MLRQIRNTLAALLALALLAGAIWLSNVVEHANHDTRAATEQLRDAGRVLPDD